MGTLVWPLTRVADRLGIAYPLIQAPLAGAAATPELVAAVANAGGLGSLGAGYLPPDAIRDAVRAIRGLTTRPFAVNLFVPEAVAVAPHQVSRMTERLRPFREALNLGDQPMPNRYGESFEEQAAVLLDEEVPIFSFTFGIPSPKVLHQFSERGVPTIGTATTVREARHLADAGVDLIVAQGSEAGGHRGTFLGPAEAGMIGTIALVPQIVDQGLFILGGETNRIPSVG